MNILDTIVAHKQKEVAERKLAVSVAALEKRDLFQRETISLKQELSKTGASGIIAEFKRKSPSKGIINAIAEADKTAFQYVQAGASGLSVLTDNQFFGGNDQDFLSVRRLNQRTPMLRKDFIIDEYQIIEAKSIGADVILLIAAILDSAEINKFVKLAHSLKLEVLLEVHDQKELILNLESGSDLIGVNNRNLKTFEISTNVSKQLYPLIPKDVVKVSESGIDNVKVVTELREIGFQGFLMGQKFMEEQDPGLACKKFINELRTAK